MPAMIVVVCVCVCVGACLWWGVWWEDGRGRVSGERKEGVEASKGGVVLQRCSALEGRGQHPTFGAEAVSNLGYMPMCRARREMPCSKPRRRGAWRDERELGLIASRGSKDAQHLLASPRSLALSPSKDAGSLLSSCVKKPSRFLPPHSPALALGEAFWKSFGGTQTTTGHACPSQSRARVNVGVPGICWS